MKFKFKIRLIDKDYLDFNVFHSTRSYYSRNMIIQYRIIIAVLFALGIFLIVFTRGFSDPSVIYGIIIMIISCVFFQVLIKKFIVFALKLQMKAMKNSGKTGYSPESTLEFYENYFTEITPQVKHEVKYSAVERISIVDKEMIYIYVSGTSAYILPIYYFESGEPYNDFLTFIREKCANIDVY